MKAVQKFINEVWKDMESESKPASRRRLNYFAVVHREMLESEYKNNITKLESEYKNNITKLESEYKNKIIDLQESYDNFFGHLSDDEKKEGSIPL